MKDLLGGKGSGLAEMTNAGLPVPPGFTISTEVCNIYYKQKAARSRRRSTARSIEQPEEAREGRRRDARSTDEPAARVGALGREVLDAGMMDTILNLGLNDETVEGLKAPHRQRPLRLRQLPPLHPDVRQRRARDSEGRVRARVRGGQEGDAARSSTPTSTKRRCARSSTRYKKVVEERDGKRLPAGSASSS